MTKVEVSVCAGCLRRQDLDVARSIEELSTFLSQAHSQWQWQLKTQSCLRLCPPKKISVLVNHRLSMSLEGDIKSLVKEVVSLAEDTASGTATGSGD